MLNLQREDVSAVTSKKLAPPKLALLAGGLATRMRPVTETIAKSMLPVAGEPFIGHQLRMVRGMGVRHVVICCGHLQEQLRGYVGDGSRFDCVVEYSGDGPMPLGTGGALRKALPLLGERFLVMYGDSFLPAPIAPVWASFLASAKHGLMTVFRNRNRWDASNVEFSRGSVLRYSKRERTPAMQHIDYGLSCFQAEALADWPDGARLDLADVLVHLLAQGELAGFEVQERFYEIGSPQGLLETDALLRGKALPTGSAPGREAQ